ncbi:DUF6090 family protein [Ichthyenterobacterium sp. W332]|uniref:DUF6090 family protein n=1 Tax=Microcosmobacter mediterraneus TaxID=3075607 RepID=A0ABU2YKI8_9FLAO|nr:DUF6090 family protein [Ichthyenterobacterium sp. W332]MDT0558332.1 DUF6090 family protein [Ichthyenterobacterium sp. W332]
MLKFFRHIRKDHMEKNKTTKYIKYAIGEIILVVIGILIALQINNWNESRKDTIKEQQILSQLKEEYAANLLQLEQKIAHRKKIITAATRVLQFIDEPITIKGDNLSSQLNVMIGNPTFKPIENNLVNSGDILLIKNKKLNQLLTTWPSNVMHIKEIENIWNKGMWESVIPLFNSFGLLRESFYKWWNDEQNIKWVMEGTFINPFQKPKLSNAFNTIEILENKELEGIASMAVSVNYAANLQSQVLHNRILEILELLNQEIKE